MYGTEARLTVVTVTGTVGCRGGSPLEQAAIAQRASVAMRAEKERVLINWPGSEVDATPLGPRKTGMVCRRARLIHRRRGRVAREKYTIASAIEPAALWHWRGRSG